MHRGCYLVTATNFLVTHNAPRLLLVDSHEFIASVTEYAADKKHFDNRTSGSAEMGLLSLHSCKSRLHSESLFDSFFFCSSCANLVRRIISATSERTSPMVTSRGKHVSRFCVTIDYNSIDHTFAVLDPVAVDSSKRTERASSSASATQTTCILFPRGATVFWGKDGDDGSPT